jgi:hypothetical protein
MAPDVRYPEKKKKDALRIHGDAIVIDGLDVSRFDAGHYRKMKEGGVTASNATVAMSANLAKSAKGLCFKPNPAHRDSGVERLREIMIH